MSSTLCVSKRNDETWHLFQRDWAFQGDRPDYTHIKDITENEAIALVETNAATDLYGHVDNVLKDRKNQKD